MIDQEKQNHEQTNDQQQLSIQVKQSQDDNDVKQQQDDKIKQSQDNNRIQAKNNDETQQNQQTESQNNNQKDQLAVQKDDENQQKEPQGDNEKDTEEDKTKQTLQNQVIDKEDEKNLKKPPLVPKKHYRYQVDKQLEKTLFMEKMVFDEFIVKRGDLFTNLDDQYAGKFKGWVSIQKMEPPQIEDQKSLIKDQLENIADENIVDDDQQDKQLLNLQQIQKSDNDDDQSQTETNFMLSYYKKECDNMIKLGIQEKDDHENNQNQDDLSRLIQTQFFKQNAVIIRVYIIDVVNIPLEDLKDCSDPFIQLQLGDLQVNNITEHLNDKVNADFYTCLELQSILPGPSQLKVQLWDYNDFFPHKIIGETIIDLENRFFSKKWRSLEEKPIEKRNFTKSGSKMPQGTVRLWVELIDIKEISLYPKYDIFLKPPQKFQLRLIIYDCEIKAEMVDIFFTARVGDESDDTDCHFRSQSGFGSFNWRLLFNITLPMEDPTLTIQCFDQNLITSNTLLGSCQFDFRDLAKDAFDDDRRASVQFFDQQKHQIDIINKKTKKKSKSKVFDMMLKKSVKSQKTGSLEKQDIGIVNLQFELVPMQIALKKPVGVGRKEPNEDPWLAPPAGRFELTLNPIKLFNQLVSREMRQKIFYICCCGCILCFIVILFPIVFGNLVSTAVLKMLGG